MSTVDIVMWSLHTIFAGVWTGSILFFVGAVLPATTAGTIGRVALVSMVTKLRWLTRIGAVVFVATGGHMAGTRYTADSLFGTGRGHLVLTMLVLWFILTAVVEIGGARLESGAEDGGVDSAIEQSRPIFVIAAVLSVLLLIDAGLLASGQII
ncbi:transporter [Halorubraceae archaeon YAN]|nr:transporter [Halorubraceae archaeon YAN]